MSTRSTLSARRNRFASFLLTAAQRLGGVAVVVAILAVGYWGPHWFFESTNTPLESNVQAKNDPDPEVVDLSEEKYLAAGIRTWPLSSRMQLGTRLIAASVKQDETCRLELRSPLNGVIQEVMVGPGTIVKEGSDLLSLIADEMGRARGDVAHCQAILELANSKSTWSSAVLEGVQDLAAKIQEPMGDGKTIPTPTADQMKLGQFGERLIKAKTAFQLARANQTSAAELQGLVSGREFRERQAAFVQATAALKAELEQIVFEAEQAHHHDLADVQDARNRLSVAIDRLTTLQGPAGSGEETNSSRLTLRAPFGGRIEQLRLIPTARVAEGEALLVLADPSRLWVVAEIPEGEFSKLKLESGSPVQIHSPALKDGSGAGKILFVGAAVNPLTRTLPVTIKLSETNLTLLPGMFVWAELPLQEPHDGLLLPSSAVARQEQSAFVFAEVAPRKYLKVPIQIVHENEDFVEVASLDLPAGSRIVVNGVFVLKSELLLEAEE